MKTTLSLLITIAFFLLVVLSCSNPKHQDNDASYKDYMDEPFSELSKPTKYTDELNNVLAQLRDYGNNKINTYPTEEVNKSLHTLVMELGNGEEEGNPQNSAKRQACIIKFMEMALKNCPDISFLMPIRSADNKFGLLSITFNTMPLFTFRAYTIPGKTGYYLDADLDFGHAYYYNRINQVDLGKKTAYLLNIETLYEYQKPYLYIERNEKIENILEVDDKLWTSFCHQYDDIEKLDFNPQSLTWTICKLDKNGILHPVSGKFAVKIVISHGKVKLVQM